MTKRKLLAHEQLFMKSHIKHGKYQRPNYNNERNL